jgi:AcrR family transcriptional regulator
LADDTRGAIREIALELFSQHGYEKTSLREIAERLGMTKAALYYHYPSKQALLLAIVAPLIDQWKAAADKAETLPHATAHVRQMLTDLLEVLLRHRAIAGLFTRDASSVLASIGPLYEDLIGVHHRLHAWLAGPAPSAGDRIRAIAATEVLGAALGWSPTMAQISDDELRETLLDAAAAVLRLAPDAR